jgi:hypothetical protein
MLSVIVGSNHVTICSIALLVTIYIQAVIIMIFRVNHNSNYKSRRISGVVLSLV